MFRRLTLGVTANSTITSWSSSCWIGVRSGTLRILGTKARIPLKRRSGGITTGWPSRIASRNCPIGLRISCGKRATPCSTTRHFFRHHQLALRVHCHLHVLGLLQALGRGLQTALPIAQSLRQLVAATIIQLSNAPLRDRQRDSADYHSLCPAGSSGWTVCTSTRQERTRRVVSAWILQVVASCISFTSMSVARLRSATA